MLAAINQIPLWMAFLLVVLALLMGGAFGMLSVWLASRVTQKIIAPQFPTNRHAAPPVVANPPFGPAELDDPHAPPDDDDFEHMPPASTEGWNLPDMEIEATAPRSDESERLRA